MLPYGNGCHAVQWSTLQMNMSMNHSWRLFKHDLYEAVTQQPSQNCTIVPKCVNLITCRSHQASIWPYGDGCHAVQWCSIQMNISMNHSWRLSKHALYEAVTPQQTQNCVQLPICVNLITCRSHQASMGTYEDGFHGVQWSCIQMNMAMNHSWRLSKHDLYEALTQQPTQNCTNGWI